MNEEQTASLETGDGLVARALWPGVRTQMRTAQRGSIPIPWSLPIERHKGLVELARCRSDLSPHLLADACCVMDSAIAQVVAAGAAGAPGLTLTCRASNALPLVITAHRMRAFLLASATAAFCQPERSRRAVTHNEIGSLRLCACARSSAPTSHPGSRGCASSCRRAW